MFRKLAPVGALLAALTAIPTAAAAAPLSDAAGDYIVVLREASDAGQVADDHARRHGAGVRHVYRHGLKGYAARVPAARVAALRADPRVAYVEPDGVVTATAQTLPWGVNRIDADVSSTRAGDGWGAVTGVNVYVIDTGIAAQPDLNVVGHANWTGDGRNTDCNGHGTHVAGTVGARDNTSSVAGVAPGVALTGLKVLGCDGSGSTSGVIAAVNWVTANARKPAVANLSLGGPASQALDDAVRKSVASGVVYTVAAGNEGANACNSSPARAGAGTNNGIVTVAATDSYNREASFSNYGSCVDIWAPGVSILSTWHNGGTAWASGTSMASPHLGGSAGLFLSRNTATAPATVESTLKANVLSPGTASRDGRPIRIVYAGRY
jgi:subtilisin family serine protease